MCVVAEQPMIVPSLAGAMLLPTPTTAGAEQAAGAAAVVEVEVSGGAMVVVLIAGGVSVVVLL